MVKVFNTNKIVFLMIMVSSFAQFGNATGKTTLYDQFKGQPGNFERTKGDLEKCQADVVDLAWEGDESNKVLRLGAKLVFAHLEQTSFVSEGLKSCTYKTITKVTDAQVSQIFIDECPNKKNNRERSQTLTVNGDKLTYDYQVKNDKKSSFVCEYKKAKN